MKSVMSHNAFVTKEVALSCENSRTAGNSLHEVYSAASYKVDRISQQICYEEFFQRYMIQNKPCIFGSFATKDWPCCKDWVKDGGSCPDFEFLKKKFGEVTVPVANCAKVKYDAQPKEDMTLGDFLSYWEEHIRQAYKSEKGCLYMKDMHFTRDCSFYKAYTTPVYFTSDWLNEFWDTRRDCDRDDYRFVYMGPKGSWTPFHADVLRSFSWSANICGTKRWILVPPRQEDQLKDHLGNLPYDITSFDATKVDLHHQKFYTPLEVVQHAGEILFVPSGWHHQVYNIEDTISINHNWFNGTSISRSFTYLQEELAKVQRSIDDCKDMDCWDEQCQLILKASSGMDYQQFFQLLAIISRRRSKVVRDGIRGGAVEPCAERKVQYQANAEKHRSKVCKAASCSESGYEVPQEELAERLTGKADLCHNQSQESGVDDDVSKDVGSHEHSRLDHSEGRINCQVKELKICSEQSGEAILGDWHRSITFWHAVFDLRQIASVLEDFMKEPKVTKLEIEYESLKPHELKEEILRDLRFLSSSAPSCS